MKVREKKEQMREEIPTAGTVSSGAEGTSPNALAGLQKASILSGRFRWVICGLLFLGVTKNYMDRQVLGVLKGPLQHQFGWNDVYYGHLVTAFQTAYALGMISVGRLIDRLGTRIGYALAMVFLSVPSLPHAPPNSSLTFAIPPASFGFRAPA